jgi:TPR repeat protein
LLAVWPEIARLGSLSSAPRADDFTSGLHGAALYGSPEAKLVLANELRRVGNCRASLFYFQQIADLAADEHSTRGQEPLVELQVLSDFVNLKGERGDEDEDIQYQMHLADQGDAVAQFNMGGLYYWGARGLDRDQERAFRYFHRAAEAGHAGAQTAVGNMLLKGEGVAHKNVSGAMTYYKKAADQDALEALNGLGYIYFFGNEEAGVARNISMALMYFERNLRDGDSLANAAHIYLHEKEFRNVEKAAAFLERAATEFGSFAASHQLGSLLAASDATVAGCWKAQRFLRAAALRASWGRKLRQGFDAFLDNDYEASVVHYLEASLMGYSRGAENAIYLLKAKLWVEDIHETLFELVDAPVPPLQRLAQGDLLQRQGKTDRAIEAWVAAAVQGDWSYQPVYRAQACYNLGMHALGLSQWTRAERYFARAHTFLQGHESEEADAARLALKLSDWRLKLAQKVPKFMLPYLLG